MFFQYSFRAESESQVLHKTKGYLRLSEQQTGGWSKVLIWGQILAYHFLSAALAPCLISLGLGFIVWEMRVATVPAGPHRGEEQVSSRR